MQASCPSCGTTVDTDDTRWCPDCGGYISWDEGEDDGAEASTTRRPGEPDEPPAPPEDATTVIPSVTQQVTCQSCGTDNPQDRSLCQHCGLPLHAPPPPPSGPPDDDDGSGIGTAWLVGGGIAAVLVVVLAVVLLGGDEETVPVAEVTSPAAPSPEATAPATPAAATESTPPAATEEPPQLQTPTWVAILRSMELDGFDRADAEAHAATIADEVGATPAVLRSDDYSSLNPGYWVVYVGEFDDSDAADAFCAGVADTVPDCYARLVE